MVAGLTGGDHHVEERVTVVPTATEVTEWAMVSLLTTLRAPPRPMVTCLVV